MSKSLVDAIERVVEASLTTEERRQLAQRLNRAAWGPRLEALWKRVDQRRKGLPPISMEEIVQEVKAVRRARAARRRP